MLCKPQDSLNPWIDLWGRVITNNLKKLAGSNENVHMEFLEEIPDGSAFRQLTETWCGQTCVQMLLAQRGVYISQQEISSIAETIKGLTSPEKLADALNKLSPLTGIEGGAIWVGGTINLPGATTRQVFNYLSKRGSWIAEFREVLKAIGHFVVVDGVNEAGNVIIRDPGTGQKMLMAWTEFERLWQAQRAVIIFK